MKKDRMKTKGFGDPSVHIYECYLCCKPVESKKKYDLTKKWISQNILCPKCCARSANSLRYYSDAKKGYLKEDGR